MKEVKVKMGRPQRLVDAPIGLFLHDNELCLKTQYRTASGRIDAYIVSSGESFCGPQPQTVQNQHTAIVTPVTITIKE